MQKRWIMAALLLQGCASTPPISDSAALPVVQNGALPMPTAADMVAQVRPYRIGPFDKLSIIVFGIEDLTRDEVQADASGRISFPLIGIVEAAGRTPGELANEIETRLQDGYVRDPQVSVNLVETVSQVITVDGQVDEPGLYPVIGRMTLMRAVATAGGTGEFAKLNHVVIFRTVEGQRMAGLYNLKAIRAGAYDDPEVYANDVIVVGDSQSRRIFKDVLQIIPLLTTPIVLLLRN